jgi:3-hydroxyisobutyrate dehydrogenase-like beta-hydroxyacid dehydrogenase
MAEIIGLIGVGKMGSALLERLTLAGKTVYAFDIKSTAMDAARAGGAETKGSSAEVAQQANLIHVFVHNDDQTFNATIEPGGALETAAPGTIILLHSTILPATTKRVAEAAAQKGIHVIDASVTSVPRLVRKGEATWLVGGPDEIVAKVRPHLESLGKAMWHFGPLGAGNIAKLAKNMTNVVERVMWAEALQLAETGGLDPRQFIDMVLSINKGSMIEQWEKILDVQDGHVEPGRARGIFSKDVQHAARLARELGLNIEMSQTAADITARWLGEWAAAEKNADKSAK